MHKNKNNLRNSQYDVISERNCEKTGKGAFSIAIHFFENISYFHEKKDF